MECACVFVTIFRPSFFDRLTMLSILNVGWMRLNGKHRDSMAHVEGHCNISIIVIAPDKSEPEALAEFFRIATIG
jgi:hypothetical protein